MTTDNGQYAGDMGALKPLLDCTRHDDTMRLLIKDLLLRATEYVAAVNALECTLLLANHDDATYRDQVQAQDQARTRAHNALIDVINICNRRLRGLLGDAMPAGGIYPDPSHIIAGNRRAIGDWAGRLTHTLFCRRC